MYNNYIVKVLKNIFLVVALILLTSILPVYVNAADFYDNCVMPDDYGDEENTERFALYTLKPECSTLCKKECESFSRSMYGNESELSSGKTVVDPNEELNEDVILDCISQCQKGVDRSICDRQPVESRAKCESDAIKNVLYSSRYYEAVEKPANEAVDLVVFRPSDQTYFQLLLRKPTSISVVCDFEDNADNIYETKFTVKANEEYLISLLSAGENKVYLCGRKNIKLIPIFMPKYSNNKWNLMPWKNKMSLPCLADLSNDDWNLIQTQSGAKDYWNKLRQNTAKITEPCAWAGRNNYNTKTGIYIQNGDEFSISWYGNFSHLPYNWPCNEHPCPQDAKYMSSRTGLINCMFYYNESSGRKQQCRNLWNRNSNILLNDGITLEGERYRQDNLDNIGLPSTEMPSIDPDKQIDPYKLRHFVYDDYGGKHGIKVEFSDAPECKACTQDTNSDICKSRTCRIITDAGYGHYLAKGYIANSFSERKELTLRHYDVNSTYGVYYDNQGGYQVDITWGHGEVVLKIMVKTCNMLLL